jgi:thiol:disulfide interchange protein DsbD
MYPAHRILLRRLTLALAAVAVIAILPELAHAADPAPPPDCGDAGASAFDSYRQRGWIWAFLAAFGFGFLTSLTPCVYPMIPIVLGVFGARGESVSRGKAMLLATFYVIGMGVTYASIGVIFALVGGQFGSLLADWRVVAPIVVIYMLMAASMFGAFELNLPTSWQNALNRVGGAGYGGAFAMGLVGGFTAAPCTGPFLVGMLGFVAKTGNAAVGAPLLFTYALGMGVLFWVLAATAAALPKSGRWMEWVKSIGGIALLAAAIYFLRPVVPALKKLGSAELWFLAASLAVTVAGLALGAIHLSFHEGPAVKARKAVAVALTVVGISGAIGWLMTPDRHLPWIQRDDAAVAELQAAEGIEPAAARDDGEDWLHTAEAVAFAKAKKEGKGVMIDFSADWCAPCAELEITFAEEEVYGALTEHFVHLKVDVSKGTDADDEWQERYAAETLPAVVFLGANAAEVGRVDRYLDAGEIMKVIRPAVARLSGDTTVGAPCVASK